MKNRHMILVELTFDKPAPASQAADMLDRLLRHPAATQANIDAAAEAGAGAMAIAHQLPRML